MTDASQTKAFGLNHKNTKKTKKQTKTKNIKTKHKDKPFETKKEGHSVAVNYGL